MGSNYFDWVTGEVITSTRLNQPWDANGNLVLATTAFKVKFSFGAAITAGDYCIARDATATNQLVLNVPTGAGFILSVQGTSALTLSSTVFTVKGILALSTATTTGAAAGEIALLNAKALRSSDASNASQTAIMSVNALNMTNVGAISITLNNTDTQSLGAAAQGHLFVHNTTDTAGALFYLQGASHSVSEINDFAADFSTAAGTAASTNVYWSVGNARYEIENNMGHQIVAKLFLLGI